MGHQNLCSNNVFRRTYFFNPISTQSLLDTQKKKTNKQTNKQTLNGGNTGERILSNEPRKH